MCLVTGDKEDLIPERTGAPKSESINSDGSSRNETSPLHKAKKVLKSGKDVGGFMLVHDHKNQKSKVFDFRETAPGASTQKMFTDRDEALVGGLAVAVPGEVKGMEEAHKQYGKLAWNTVVKPAADLARNGFMITKAWLGQKVKRPDLAKTLDIIAAEGAKAFYDGTLTDSIINAIQSANPKGILTRKDLKDYKVVVRDVVKTTYNGHTVISAPVPASGPVVLSILNILEGYKFSPKDVNKTSTYHKILEAFKFAYAQQQQLGDPADPAYKASVTEKMLKQISSIQENVHYQTCLQQYCTIQSIHVHSESL
ncbi:hypothetical protein KUTeg_015776 [Tegillarca granosa]|uniref:Gamma-glutamyltransferase n=1 Tax=Tegillarca granosa TaxID=220873 RepID=A0ABQ9ETK2_TEGGR|nr:hypothetical protein KUTeg_015776 [Tegillarca granosa]